MGLLDERTLDLGDPDVVQLRTYLVAIFTRETPITDVARLAKLEVGMVTWRGNAVDMWTSVLERAATEGKVPALLDVLKGHSETQGKAELLALIGSLQAGDRPPPPGLDPYSIGMLPSRRAFIDRMPLRDLLRNEFGDDNGVRVLLVKGGDGVYGVTYSWHLINVVGKRTGRYDAYRIDLKDSATPQTPRQVFEELCRQLEVKVDPVDETAQPDNVVRLLLQSFKALGRSRMRRTCLVFDGFTVETADEWARKLVMGMARAASQDEAGDMRIVLLWVDSELTGDLAKDAQAEVLTLPTVEHLKTFFRNAAEAAEEAIEEPAGMEVLLTQVLGPPPHGGPIDLGKVGPEAARVATTAFGGAR